MAEPQIDHEYLDKVKQDHADLGRLVTKLRGALDEGKDTSALAKLLAEMRDELVEHFRLEEDGGYLDDAVAYAPRLTGQAKYLLEQHKELLQLISGLCDAVPLDGPSNINWEQVQAKGDHFVKTLLDHERGENMLVQEAYEQDIGSQD